MVIHRNLQEESSTDKNNQINYNGAFGRSALRGGGRPSPFDRRDSLQFPSCVLHNTLLIHSLPFFSLWPHTLSLSPIF